VSERDILLVKDFCTETLRIVLYWEGPDQQKLSPDFVSMRSAQNWWLDYQFELFSGDERRASTVDRRWLVNQRNDAARGIIRHTDAPDGRRCTDKPIKVGRDISRVRLLQHYARHPELHEREVIQLEPREEALQRWGVG